MTTEINTKSMKDAVINKECNETEIIDRLIKKYENKQPPILVPNHSINIVTNQNTYKHIRLNDGQFYMLYKNSLAISEDYNHTYRLSRDKHTVYNNFSKFYVVLKDLFGESGEYYDNWKGSFSFPFLIYCERKEKFEYLMNIYNIRSSIEFNLMKIIHPDDNKFDRRIMHKPFDDFPREEINYYIDYFIGMLTGYFRILKAEYDNFYYKTVESNIIIFGYKNGTFFDKQYETEEDFNAAIQELKKFESQ